MYAIDWAGLLTRPARTGQNAHVEGRAGRLRSLVPVVHRTVWALGITSLLTDVSSEMVASILPMYLVMELGMRPLAFGIIDGMYQGVAALVRVAAGVFADRRSRYKEAAASGYALSALCRVALLAVGAAPAAIAAIVAVDRIGKGVRTAPRDALISLRSKSDQLATAFGVHRSLDAAGAMLGPFVAFALLAAMPSRFDVLFAVSFAVALAGLGVILLCVEPARPEIGTAQAALPWRAAMDAAGTPQFRSILIAGFLLGLPTISDGFIFLSLQRQLHIGASAFPLFYVATSLLTALFALPMGRLADRAGRIIVLLGGHVLLALLYVVLLGPSIGPALAIASIALLGAYYAATDGVLTAAAAAVLPKTLSGSGLSFLATATNVSRLLASVFFGLLWQQFGIHAATTVFFLALVASIAGSAFVLGGRNRRAVSPAA
jgi:MFS family permease